jgi:hypothetical protein
MKRGLIVAAVVLAFPLLTLAYLYLNAAKIALIHNRGDKDVEISLVVGNGITVERTDDKLLKARGFKLMIFFPRTEGDLSADCAYGGNTAIFFLRPVTTSTVSVSDIDVDACNRMLSKRGFAL